MRFTNNFYRNYFVILCFLIGVQSNYMYSSTNTFSSDDLTFISEGADELSAVDQVPITVNGRVTDIDGNPLIGASVLEVGTTNGTATDALGDYTITVDSESTLKFSYLGYADFEIEVQGQTTLNIELQESASTLDEIVVTGYGRQVKRDITGSVASLSSSQIEDIPAPSFENAILG